MLHGRKSIVEEFRTSKEVINKLVLSGIVKPEKREYQNRPMFFNEENYLILKDYFNSREYTYVKNPVKRYCSVCNKGIDRNNKSGKCKVCNDADIAYAKYLHWLKTGDLGLSVRTTVKGNLRELLKEHYGYTCSICGISEWNGREITLVLDHIDGDALNDTEDNLRFICPNCDSQLDTYKSRNRNSARTYRKKNNLHGKLLKSGEEDCLLNS